VATRWAPCLHARVGDLITVMASEPRRARAGTLGARTRGSGGPARADRTRPRTTGLGRHGGQKRPIRLPWAASTRRPPSALHTPRADHPASPTAGLPFLLPSPPPHRPLPPPRPSSPAPTPPNAINESVAHLGPPSLRSRLLGAAAGSAAAAAAAGVTPFAADGRASLPSTEVQGMSCLMEKLTARRRRAASSKVALAAACETALESLAIKTTSLLDGYDAIAEAVKAIQWAAAGERDAPPSPDDEWFEPPLEAAAVGPAAAPSVDSGGAAAAGQAVGTGISSGAPAADVPLPARHAAVAAPRVAAAAVTFTAATPVRTAVARHGVTGGALASVPMAVANARAAGAGGRQPTRAPRNRPRAPLPVVDSTKEYANMPGGGARGTRRRPPASGSWRKSASAGGCVRLLLQQAAPWGGRAARRGCLRSCGAPAAAAAVAAAPAVPTALGVVPCGARRCLR